MFGNSLPAVRRVGVICTSLVYCPGTITNQTPSPRKSSGRNGGTGSWCGDFCLFEALEGICLGTDYAYLEQRAREQRQRVEMVRLEAARTVFAAKAVAAQ
jgi:hypothetical protein